MKDKELAISRLSIRITSKEVAHIERERKEHHFRSKSKAVRHIFDEHMNFEEKKQKSLRLNLSKSNDEKYEQLLVNAVRKVWRNLVEYNLGEPLNRYFDEYHRLKLFFWQGYLKAIRDIEKEWKAHERKE